MIVHMIGNAHIDPVWLWHWQSGADEALATFRSAADRCDEYPDFIFTHGEAWTYQQVERIDPGLFARVQRLVARGQWHITGSFWVQPDANLPTEMGWRKQFQHSQQYFWQHFGVRPTIMCNVDTFGHPATLPDLLAQFPIQAYVFHRPSPTQVELPANTFRWRGPQGGEILGMRIVPAYVTRAHELQQAISLAVEGANPDLGHVMCFYGVGNHGGGPTKENILYILEHQHAFPDIELRFSTPQLFFDAINPQRASFPEVTTELQHTFPGCYSVMHTIKQTQRSCEYLLDQAESAAQIYTFDEAQQHTQNTRLHAAWDDLLFTQFHDILAGTSIPSAWQGVYAMQGRAQIIGEEVLYEVTRRWARQHLPAQNEHQIILLNPSEHAWSGLVEFEPHLDFDLWRQRQVSDHHGRSLPFQIIQAEALIHIHRILFPAEIAARGSAQLLLLDSAAPAEITSDLSVSSEHIANSTLHVTLSPSGIQQITFYGQSILGAEGAVLQLRHDNSDTWTTWTDSFQEQIGERFVGDGWIVEEEGPLRARVRMEGWLGHSRLRWTLSLEYNEPRLQMQIEVAFNEHFMLLQLPIQLASPVASWCDGQVAGSIERQVGETEWPVQGWSRVELYAGISTALVTQDAYSLSLDAHDRWQWTLLRSPKMAWGGNNWIGENHFLATGKDYFTDQGEHHFSLELLFGKTGQEHLSSEALKKRARQLVQKPIIFDRYEGMNRLPWGKQIPPHLA